MFTQNSECKLKKGKVPSSNQSKNTNKYYYQMLHEILLQDLIKSPS